jgi:hypothetical protein
MKSLPLPPPQDFLCVPTIKARASGECKRRSCNQATMLLMMDWVDANNCGGRNDVDVVDDDDGVGDGRNA